MVSSNNHEVTRILRIDASGRKFSSLSREIADNLINRLEKKHSQAKVITRDLIDSQLPFVDQKMINAFFTPAVERTEAQNQHLEVSHTLIDELNSADIVVLAVPIYNFSVPAVLKAWIDLVCRAGVTFKFTENGAVGLIRNCRAYAIVTSGGTEIGSNIDFLTSYLKHVFNFIGIEDLEIIRADGRKNNQLKLELAMAQIDRLLEAKALAY
ncbi:MAG: NAD(P)H-dependent oxidoreductase [Cyanobacteria bacterium P01_A01_bin.40]